MPGADGERPACPVCGLAILRQAACPECGWTLRTLRRHGQLSGEQRRQFGERLDAARRVLDARVAATLSADPARFAGLIRGGRPTVAEWQAARHAAEQAMAGAVSDERLPAIVAEILRELTPDAAPAVVEIDDQGITVARLRLDAFWSPMVDRPEPTRPWRELLPMLSEDPDRRRFQLAGGFGSLDRDRLWSALQQAADRIHDGALVVCRPAGWQVLDRAAELIGQQPASRIVRVRPEVGGAALASLLDGTAARAPLRCGYGLIVAVADPVTMDVHTETRPLFAPGDRPGLQVSVPARRAPGDRGDVTLAVLAGKGDGKGDGALTAQDRLLVIATAAPEGPEYRISAVLDGPGRVRITEPAAPRPQTRAWPEILAAVPRRICAPIGPFDLVCAIDMAGPSDQVSERRRLVGELLTLLESEYPGPEMLRVSVLGCTDHVFGRRSERRNVVRGAPLASAGEARARLARITGAEAVYPDAAPVEDLLDRAAGLLSGSRALGRQARLLMVGQRGPHPRAQGSGMPLPCPFRSDWRAALRELTGPCAATCVGVTDALPQPGQARTWRELGRDRLCQRDSTDARHLGEYLGILPAHSQHVPIPLVMSN